jgi:uncharacterized peroxidase-related enzyme
VRFVTKDQEFIMSPRINPVDVTQAEGKAKELLQTVKAKYGMIPNLLKTMVHSPAVLEAYLALGGALSHGVLSAQSRERIALAVSQVNCCEYCLSAHSLTGKMSGLTPAEIRDARQGKAQDLKSQAMLNLALNLIERRGDVSDEQLNDARVAGLSDAEISEVVGNVAAMTLTNYYNQLAHTDVDFPKVSVAL